MNPMLLFLKKNTIENLEVLKRATSFRPLWVFVGSLDGQLGFTMVYFFCKKASDH